MAPMDRERRAGATEQWLAESESGAVGFSSAGAVIRGHRITDGSM